MLLQQAEPRIAPPATRPPQPRITLGHHALAILFALVGGLLGIIGALFAEGSSSVPLIAVFIGAPVAEEILKPVGIYIYMLRWRDVLRNQLHIATLASISGICFGLIESLVYVTLYVPDHSQEFFIYRFTVTVALHGIASFIAGLGISSQLIAWANGQAPFPRRAKWAFAVAIGLHALYNTGVTIMELSGFLTFD
jgi:RsiW-degrading membrane proteinase PrsW (M82 family)